MFPTGRGNFKPDLVAWNGVQSVVIDVTVTSDNLPDPNTAHMEKVNKYSSLEEITSCVERNSGLRPHYSALAISWRGVISPQSAQDMVSLGLTKSELKLLSAVVVEKTALIHRHFHQSTYRVKMNRY